MRDATCIQRVTQVLSEQGAGSRVPARGAGGAPREGRRATRGRADALRLDAVRAGREGSAPSSRLEGPGRPRALEGTRAIEGRREREGRAGADAETAAPRRGPAGAQVPPRHPPNPPNPPQP